MPNKPSREPTLASADPRVPDPTRARTPEEELHASEERYRTLFESIDEGFCVIEVLFDDAKHPVDYRFLEVNRVFEKQTGISSAVGRRMREIAPTHEEHWFQIYGQVALTGEPRRFENPAVALGRFYDVYSFRVGKAEQRHVAVLFNDITDRKQAETERARFIKELSEAQELLRFDLEATNRLLKVGSLFLREGNLELVLGEILDAAIAISGADFGTMQLLNSEGGDLEITAHRGFSAEWLEFWDQTRAGEGACGTALQCKERVIVEDVETSPIFVGTPALAIQREASVRAVQSTPIFSRTGQPIGMLSTHFRKPGRPSERRLRLVDLLVRQAADILERAQAEEALEKANQRLLEADRRKNEFLGMLSHELRNPLAPIRSSIHILERSAPGDEQARRAQAVIDRQVEHMTRLVEDLLDVTRISSGKVQLQREVLDLNELLQQTIEEHRVVENASDLDFVGHSEQILVNGDRTRLSQVIGNVLQNSLKFTPRGGKTTVSVARDVTQGRAIVVVKDTGRGIPPEILPRLFEPFTQADSSLDRTKGGLGLGLAVVKGLVEMHGGSVKGESEGTGKGATFTITLPLAEGPPETRVLRTNAGGIRRRVLVIEDNVDAADSLKELLELSGHDVEVASTGPEGLEKARAFGPDLVLCDIGLPEMTGYDVVRAMRADPALGDVRVIALTGYAGPDDVAKATQAGFDGHVAKPFTMEWLAKTLT